MTDDRAPISADERRGLEQELATLRGEREELATSLRGTDAAGDTGDQANRMERAMQMDPLDGRIREIDDRLRYAGTAAPSSGDVIGVGSAVDVRFADGAEETLHVGDVPEEADQTLVTADSPLGQALLGSRAGDTVTYEAPDGQETVVVASLRQPRSEA
ncbi:MAG: GreA/GreB family elongation factor [Streptosporangiales bacterium]